MLKPGRGSAAVVVAATAMVVCLLMLQNEVAQAATFTVGDSGGWGFNVANWTKGKRFRAGDFVVFNYLSGVHNVVAVNKAGYDSCSSPRGTKVFQSGNDRIKLVKGINYFICTVAGHCQAGMKIAIPAL